MDWTNTRGTLHQSSTHLGTKFFTCSSQSYNAESASQALFDLKLQLTPLLENSECSIPPKEPPPVTGSIAQTDLYGTAPLYIGRPHFLDSRPIGSLNIS
jgi:hypothetical protein